MIAWTFPPDIGRRNIRAKLPENNSNIKIAGQIDLLINVRSSIEHYALERAVRLEQAPEPNVGEGAQPELSREERLDPHSVYFVRTCCFEFEFHSLDQLQACLAYFSRKIQPTSRIPEKDLPNYGGDHSEVQRWFERLPMKLMDNHRTPKVATALRSALEDFKKISANKSVQATAGMRRGSRRSPQASRA